MATFYTMYKREPVCDYLVGVCTSISCFLLGADDVLAAIEDESSTPDGETSDDGLFSVEHVECIGACGGAPAVQVNYETIEGITPEKAADLVKWLSDTRPDFQVGPRSTPIGAEETYVLSGWGTVGECALPNNTTGLSLNVTAVDAKGKVVFGSTVELLEEETGKEIEYRIVGEDEADIKSNLISFTSPIARALIGKSEGDVVSFQAPGGEKTFEILEVRYV